MVRFRHKLPREPALELARLAKVKRSEIEYFCDAVSNTVNEVWQKDRRASSPKRSTGLVAAARAALTLNRAICKLNKEDQKWLLHILRTGEFRSRNMAWSGKLEPYEQWDDFSQRVWVIAADLSTAAGLSGPPSFPGLADHRPGISRIRDISFALVVSQLRSRATECGGGFKYNKRYQSGTLLQALEVLRPHLPNRVIPRALPLTTIDRLIAASNKASRLTPYPYLNEIAPS
jgi:hypothetical protein